VVQNQQSKPFAGSVRDDSNQGMGRHDRSRALMRESPASAGATAAGFDSEPEQKIRAYRAPYQVAPRFMGAGLTAAECVALGLTPGPSNW